MVNLSKIIYLSLADFTTLVNGGTVTKEGQTYTYDASVDYRVKFESETVTELSFPTPTAADANKVVAVNASGEYVLVTVLPTPAVADAGKSVVVNAQGAYALADTSIKIQFLGAGE